MQFVEIELHPQETVVAELGNLLVMDEDIEMRTMIGDGTKTMIVSAFCMPGVYVIRG